MKHLGTYIAIDSTSQSNLPKVFQFSLSNLKPNQKYSSTESCQTTAEYKTIYEIMTMSQFEPLPPPLSAAKVIDRFPFVPYCLTHLIASLTYLVDYF